MQTIYYSTRNFIRHTDNVIDLAEYRRKLALAQKGNLAPAPQPVYDSAPVPQARSRREWPMLALDLAASLSVVVMAAAFTFQVLAA
ncbi:MAG: hypothetical protein IKK44_02110 [Clostridium sp.]|nr:hypothetical protein [Clostridium sp.]